MSVPDEVPSDHMTHRGKYFLKETKFKIYHKTNDVIDCRVKNKIKNQMSKRIHDSNDVIVNRDTTFIWLILEVFINTQKNLHSNIYGKP